MKTLLETGAAFLIAAAVVLTGCSISTNKHGDSDNVKIATPFGGLQVKTDEADVLGGIGLPAYPGATLVRKEGNDNGSADINLSFGSFQLKVKAASYHTGDSPDKVLAFYRKGLGRYGNVIQCDGKHPVGGPIRTAEGLTCDDDTHTSVASSDSYSKAVHIAGSDDNAKYQLKAGSRKHQHIVDINPEGAGTKFGLVALDLPTDFHFGREDGKDDRQ